MDFLPFFSAETWILMAASICLFIAYGCSTFGVFEKLGIPGPKPKLYLGTIGRNHKVYYIDDLINAKQYGKVWGVYELRKPQLFVADPSMLKIILVKECFSNFTNRRNFILNGELYDAVSLMEDDQWRRVRGILTPFFTSGRIKEMFEIMKHNSRKLTNELGVKALKDDIISVRDFFGAYSMDLMLSSAFSVDSDSYTDPSDPMAAHARMLFRMSPLLFIICGCFPFLTALFKVLGVTFFSKPAIKYLASVVKRIRAIHQSRSQKTRMDLLQMMIESQKGNDSSRQEHESGLTDHEITSQSIIFLFAGYETSSTTLQFVVYCLASNPHIMRRLQEEIDTTFPNKAPIQYEALMRMEYLDNVIKETLRLYPPVPRLDRVAKATVEINGITIPKGMITVVPVYALHRQPDLWPEPEKFEPERFNKENKHNIDPHSYLPFGEGPRNCIGMRFALVMVKLALVEVFRSYSFSVCEETETPLEMDPVGLLNPLQPIRVKISSRSPPANQ